MNINPYIHRCNIYFYYIVYIVCIFYYILHIYIRALLPYDCRSCNGCHHQYVFTNIVFIDFFCFIGGKDSANRMYNKMNLFIFYAEVQPVFVFATNISTLF